MNVTPGLPRRLLDRVPLLASLVLIACTRPASSAPTLEAFFKPAPDTAVKLDAHSVYPRGRIFPMTMFSVGGIGGGKAPEASIQAALKRYKADGFTMIGPQYELSDRLCADAEATGLKAVYTVGMPLEFHDKTPPKFTADDVKAAIGDQVAKVARSRSIAWWYLQPEELRYWRKDEMMYLRVATETIRQADPLKRPIWMYDPGHRAASGLTHTAKRLDLCGKGIYTNYSGQRDTRIWVRWSIEQEAEAVRLANPSATPIAVPEMFQQPAPEYLPLISKWVRHDVYLSLISGAKGVVVFSMRKRPKFDAHETYYRAYAKVAHELCGPLDLGQVFLFGERRDDVKVGVVDGPEHIAPKEGTGGIRPPAKEYAPVSILDVAHKRNRYLLAVNSANTPVRVHVTGLPAEKLVAEDVFGTGEPRQIEKGRFEMRFDPLAVRALRFEPISK